MNTEKMNLTEALRLISEEMKNNSPEESAMKIASENLVRTYKEAREIADWCDALINGLLVRDTEVLWPVYPKR